MSSSQPPATGSRRERGGIFLRGARPCDAAALTELALRSKASRDYSSELLGACRAEPTLTPETIGTPGLYVTVAESRGAIAGYSALTLIRPDRSDLEALVVDPPRIGAGIGRQLLEHAMDQAKGPGAVSMKVQSDPGAARFYSRAGGRAIGVEASGSIPGRVLPIFEFVLQDPA